MSLSNTAVPIEYGQFREQVLAGQIPVNREISMEMNRIDELIANPEYYYDDQAILGFIKFCEEEMTLDDGSAIQLLPSFRLWAEQLLAWYYFPEERFYNQDTRRYEYQKVKKRLVNKQYLIVGRGAAKSMYQSMLETYFLIMDPATTDQVVTAPTMKQANEITGPIKTAIRRARGPLFQFMTTGNRMARNWQHQLLVPTEAGIENFLTNSIIEQRPMTIDKLQGLRSKYNSVDEWLSGATKEDVIEALEQGSSKHDDWVIVATSSEGTYRNGVGDSIKMELLQRLRGEVYDPHTSIFYYKLDDVKEVGQPEYWVKANPNIGATVSYSTYERAVQTAETNPAKRNDILAKRFGIPVEGYTYFFTYEETIPHGPQNFDGMECALGADLSQGDDFCAFTFLFPLDEHLYGIKTRSYVCRTKMNRLPSATKLKYEEFVKEGTLCIMDTPTLDMSEVFEDLDKFIMTHEYIVNALGYDPYNAREFIDRWEEQNGSFGLEKVRQGARTESVPLGEIKNLAEERALLFDEELMTFAMGNSIAIQDNNGNYKLAKKRSHEKIDNVAALIDALVAMHNNKEVFM